jgi:outer membrane lipoprotein-sorting protein
MFLSSLLLMTDNLLLFRAKAAEVSLLMKEHVEKKAVSVSSYKADFFLVNKMGDKEIKAQGKLIWYKDKNLFQELIFPNNVKAFSVLDGKYLWEIIPTMNIVYKVDGDILLNKFGWRFVKSELPIDLRYPFIGIEEKSISYLGTKHLNISENQQILTYCFKGNKPILRNKKKFISYNVKIWMDLENGLLRKYVVYDKNNSPIYEQLFYSIEINPEIDMDFFKPQITNGMKVIDNTEELINIYSNALNLK